MRIEILQIVYTLAYADLENRKLEFVRNRQSDTALSRTIKFRYDYAIQIKRIVELLSLLKAILPSCSIDDKHCVHRNV